MSEENIYTFENPEYRKTYWHTCSHVLAQAMKHLHPEVKLAIGPSIENGFYYDFDITSDRFSKVSSVASFLPIFAGVCDKEQCAKLVEHLNNPKEFDTEFPVPSISKKDKSFGTDMWRGPVWINYNYMISNGLSEYGYSDTATKIKEKTISVINEWYNRTGTVYEFYDSQNQTPPFCFNRKGEVVEPYDFRVKYQSIRDYGWTATLAFDMLHTTQIKPSV